jgi:hypothetical protein
LAVFVTVTVTFSLAGEVGCVGSGAFGLRTPGARPCVIAIRITRCSPSEVGTLPKPRSSEADTPNEARILEFCTNKACILEIGSLAELGPLEIRYSKLHVIELYVPKTCATEIDNAVEICSF